MIMEDTERYINEYPFLNYIKEDKSGYKTASSAGFYDPDDLFLIGESGGFLLNINYGDKFVNTHLFYEAANFYRKHKTYTFYEPDSVPHRQYRLQEEDRRRNGLTRPCLLKANGDIVDIRITGDHYNFINYTIIEQLDESSVKRGDSNNTAEKKIDFSKFIDAQFWTWHIMEFVKNNGFHLIIDKTRRGGFSYIMAADSANEINLNPNKVCIHVADDKKYLIKTGGLSDFTINNLRFYETNTPFARGIYTTDKENFKLGFKTPNGIESSKSWRSTLFSVSADNNPDCAIGKDARKVKVEEVSTMTNFDSFMDVTAPAMRTGAYTTGCLMAWGTATSGDMQVFEQNFYNPKEYNFMPFENVWDKDCRNEICGYFKPYCWGLQGELDGQYALDKDGNSNFELSLKIAFKERQHTKDNATFSKYINYLGQYALMPAESFSSTTENMFIKEEFIAWEERLRTDSTFKFYVDGQLREKDNGEIYFVSNERLIADGGKLNVDVFPVIENVPRKAHENPHGCIRRFFSPQVMVYADKKGVRRKGIPEGLYSATYDPVGINKDKKEITSSHSHNSFKIWMNPHSCNNYIPKLVMVYYGRPNTLEECDRMFYLACKYYNCIGTAGVEVNRGETVSNFASWNALKYLEKQDINVWDNSVKGSATSSYGYVIGDGIRKLDALRLTCEMLYTVVGKDELGRPIKFYQTIYSYQDILEIKKWNSTGNFDRVSEMIIRGIQWRAMDIDATKKMQHRKKVSEDDTYSKHIMKRPWF